MKSDNIYLGNENFLKILVAYNKLPFPIFQHFEQFTKGLESATEIER